MIEFGESIDLGLKSGDLMRFVIIVPAWWSTSLVQCITHLNMFFKKKKRILYDDYVSIVFFTYHFWPALEWPKESCSITADTNCKCVDPYSLWASWSHAIAYRTKRLSAWISISVHPSICSIIRPQCQSVDFPKLKHRSQATSSKRSHHRDTSSQWATNRWPATWYLSPAWTLPPSGRKQRQLQQPRFWRQKCARWKGLRQGRLQSKGQDRPHPDRRAIRLRGYLAGRWGLGEGFSVFGLLQFVVFTSMSPCQWSCCSGCL